MDNFLFNVLASLTASVVVAISKLFKKAKSHSRTKSDLRVEFKFIFKSKK
ncbi:MAG: type I toxin-antitoxin system toxin [Clostridioides difficile]